MAYPGLAEYQAALQNPALFLHDPELKTATPEKTPFGLPRPRSGGFAVTYKMSQGKKSWALRCFHKETPDLQQRYGDIAKFFGPKKPRSFVNFEYQPTGILINGNKYPIVKMDWIEALTLDSYVSKHFRDRTAIRNLRNNFDAGIQELWSLGCAHGDLQHGNILVNTGIVFVDYDGMYVPGMQATTSNEIGHVNYQSPVRRASDFGSHIDRFSAMVITLSLEAIEHDPSLWSEFGEQENLLFTARDYADPANSPVFKRLKSIDHMRDKTIQLELACRTPLELLPTLNELRSKLATLNASQQLPAGSVKAQLFQYPVINATDTTRIKDHTGQIIQIVGLVEQVNIRFTRFRMPFAFVNFADWRKKGFYVVAWKKVLDEFLEAESKIENLEKKWITLTGLVQDYDGTPQIVAESMHAFRVLPQGKNDADQMIADSMRPVTVQSSSPVKSRNQQLVSALETPSSVSKTQLPIESNKPISTASPLAQKYVTVAKQSGTSSTSQRNRDLLANLQTSNKAQEAQVSTPPQVYWSGHKSNSSNPSSISSPKTSAVQPASQSTNSAGNTIGGNVPSSSPQDTDSMMGCLGAFVIAVIVIVLWNLIR